MNRHDDIRIPDDAGVAPPLREAARTGAGLPLVRPGACAC